MAVVSNALRVVEASYIGYRRTWRGRIISTFLNPVLFLAGMGFALGTMVDRGAGEAQLPIPFLTFVATGGYALEAYDKFRRIVRGGDGSWRLAHPQHARRHRMNAGIIVDSEMVDVRIRGGGGRGGRSLGKVEERFAAMLRPGDTFAFAGLTLEVEQLRDMEVIVRASKKSAMIPSYGGQRLPLTTHLASRVRELLVDRAGWARFPDEVREWLEVQDWRSSMPGPGTLLVESFPHAGREYSVFYTFEGWNANQSLGMLITRRMEDRGLSPIGFIANDYSLGVWGLKAIGDPRAMLSPDILTDEFVDWVQGSYLLRRAFREVAVIGGLVERQHPGQRKSGRQVTFSTDLIYDVLRRHQPDHLLLKTARTDAAAGLLDVARLGQLLERIQGRIRHVHLERPSPFCVPVLVQIGRERVGGGQAAEMILDASAYGFDEEDLIAEVMGEAETEAAG